MRKRTGGALMVGALSLWGDAELEGRVLGTMTFS